ncbi:MAG: DDE-type integrase/transposase/recombinase [Chloroflexi bacterium]|nr:DDE-type integrase/transposase/recombinase [Chloroflexota bacterium]
MSQYTYFRGVDVETGKYATIMTKHEPELLTCKHCSSNDVVRFGHYKDTQYYWCNNCRRKFSIADTLPKMKTPINQIASALGMYYDGLSINKIRYQLKHLYNTDVSDFAVYNWITRFTRDAIVITSQYKPNTGYVWLCDETVIKISGKKYWLISVIDIKTRFLLASRLSHYRRVEDIQETLKEAYNRSGMIPKVLMTDRLQAYIYAIPMTFGDKAKHLRVKKLTAKPSSSIIERMQGTIKDRIKTMRGLKSLSTARLILNGFLINYNYFRPHETLSQQELTTPAQKAGIKFPYSNWESLIRHSREAKAQIFTKPLIPVLKELPLTEVQKKRIVARQKQRDLLESIRKQLAKTRQDKITPSLRSTRL